MNFKSELLVLIAKEIEKDANMREVLNVLDLMRERVENIVLERENA